MNADEISLNVTILEADSDTERLDDLTRCLMRELRESGLESVERPSVNATPEPYAKGDEVLLGALAVAAVPALLPGLIGLLQNWLQRGEGRLVRIETPAGLKVEFVPNKLLSNEEIIELAGKLMDGSEDPSMVDSEPLRSGYDWQMLRYLLSERFSEEDLRSLAFDLNVDYENLPGRSKADKGRELIVYLRNRDGMADMLELCRRQRPDVPWSHVDVGITAKTSE